MLSLQLAAVSYTPTAYEESATCLSETETVTSLGRTLWAGEAGLMGAQVGAVPAAVGRVVGVSDGLPRSHAGQPGAGRRIVGWRVTLLNTTRCICVYFGIAYMRCASILIIWVLTCSTWSAYIVHTYMSNKQLKTKRNSSNNSYV